MTSRRKEMPPGARKGLIDKRLGVFPSAGDLNRMDPATRKKMAEGFRILGKIATGETKPPTEEEVVVDPEEGSVFTPAERAQMIEDAKRRQNEDMKRSGEGKPAGED